MQHVAMCCSVVQCKHVSTHEPMGMRLQCVAVCCSLLQFVAVCCSVLQCVAVCCSVLQCIAVCCSVLQCVLQCVAVCCSVLQRVAVCCSVLQRVVACCSVSQRVAVCCKPRHANTLGNFAYFLYTIGQESDRFSMCVAACCSGSQRVAACCVAINATPSLLEIPPISGTLLCKTMTRSTCVLQRVAVCFSML